MDSRGWLVLGAAELVALAALLPRVGWLLHRLGAARLAAESTTVAASVVLLGSVLVDPSAVSPGNLLAAAPAALATGLLVTTAVWTVRRPAGLALRSGMVPAVVGTFAGLGAISAALLLATFTGDRLHEVHGAIVILTLVALWTREMLRGRQSADLMRRLSDQALTDPLTGLGNRRSLAAAMAHALGGDRGLAVLTIDLDHFKRINTLLGHHVGDDLLVAVARALQQEPGPAFRLGGDEFALVVQGTAEEAEVVAERLTGRVEGMVRAVPGASQVDVSVSVGIAEREPADSPAEPAALLNRSGDAMREAKAAGRARVVTHDGAVACRRRRREDLERRLRLAVAGDRVDLWLQPVISLPEMRLVGAEALARWTDEELGDVSPVEFVPVAEDCGLMVGLGLQLARKAMQQVHTTGMDEHGLNGGVNVSAAQLRMPDFAGRIADLLAETGVEPSRFVLEITESMQIEDDDPAVTALWRLADLGLPIAIDDFGTGFSSLSQLSRLPVQILKLDRSLTQQLDDPRGLAVARCVTEMARSLGIDVVAEGIETPAQLDAVRALGVGFGQGWLFARAVPEEQFAGFVQNPQQLFTAVPAQRAPGQHA